MPEHIQKILNNPTSRMAETFENVTILYADICGFTQYSSDKQPN
jgi:class 3 adenylate cyclase